MFRPLYNSIFRWIFLSWSLLHLSAKLHASCTVVQNSNCLKVHKIRKILQKFAKILGHYDSSFSHMCVMFFWRVLFPADLTQAKCGWLVVCILFTFPALIVQDLLPYSEVGSATTM
jgi:hypothetical protein